MRLLRPLLTAFLLLIAGLARAQDGRPPVVDAAAEARADRVIAIGDTDPVSRLNMVLAALELDEGALFALAGTHPGIVEQVVNPYYRQAVDYIASLPAPELGRIRRGETVIRTQRDMRGEEWDLAVALAESFDFKGFKSKKIGAVRVQPFEARVVRVEVTYNKSKTKTLSGIIELAWPATPERDEQSRNVLTRHFGARPSRDARGLGSTLALKDGSFEAPDTLQNSWAVADGFSLGSPVPRGEVSIDGQVAVDGARSIRFYNNEKTRLFPEVVQRVAVTPGSTIRARAYFKADKLRVEYLQRDDYVFLGLLFLDGAGQPVGQPAKAVGRLGTHPWEMLEVTTEVPAGATAVQVGLSSAVSGTGWFDGVTLETL